MLMDIKINYTQWPRRDDGSPIFTSTNDAFFYAELISSNRDECFNILALRANILVDMETMRSKENVDMDDMFSLAFQAQLYRECLEEVNRIDNVDENL